MAGVLGGLESCGEGTRRNRRREWVGMTGEQGDVCRHLLSSIEEDVGLIYKLWAVNDGVSPLGELLGTYSKAGANGERDDVRRHLLWIISGIWEAGARVSPRGTLRRIG